MKLRTTLLALVSLLLPLAALHAAPPNIVYILADDLGWADTGVYGSRYHETPNIDRLAAQGMRLTAYHNCQNCAPTRAALMSGQYGARTGIYTVGGIARFDWQSRPLRPVDNVTKLPEDKITLAQTLKNAGYATAMFGKWHLGTGAFHPSKRGFDEAIETAGRHFDFETSPAVEHPKDAYLADWLTDRGVDFIRRKKDGPFFLYLPHFGVHSPWEAKPELVAKFQPKPGVGGQRNPTYAAMIASVDESVGRILALLDELKLADHTIVIFSSDNGGVGGYARPGGLEVDPRVKVQRGKVDAETKAEVTDNAPLRSGKGSLYEGGTREPFIVRWPGKVPPGSTCDVPAIHVDVYPTLLELTGTAAPEGYTLDGESLAPLLTGRATTLKRDAIFQHFPGYLGAGPGLFRTTPVSTIIAGDWKLMQFLEDQRLELYNLREDLGEAKNLATAEPEKAQQLLARLDAWRTAIKAPMPQPNQDIRAIARPGGKGRRKAGGNE